MGAHAHADAHSSLLSTERRAPALHLRSKVSSHLAGYLPAAAEALQIAFARQPPPLSQGLWA